jgi:hypothetical protein
MRGGTGHGAETEVEGAAAVLRNLAGVQDGECHRTIVQAGAITPLVALLSNGTEQQAKQAMRALQAWAVVAEFQLAMMRRAFRSSCGSSTTVMSRRRSTLQPCCPR